jgi:hypothetical protein
MIVAGDTDALQAGPLDVAITQHADGSSDGCEYVFAGNPAQLAALNCDNWTNSPAANPDVMRGTSCYTDSHWYDTNTGVCGHGEHVLCVER